MDDTTERADLCRRRRELRAQLEREDARLTSELATAEAELRAATSERYEAASACAQLLASGGTGRILEAARERSAAAASRVAAAEDLVATMRRQMDDVLPRLEREVRTIEATLRDSADERIGTFLERLQRIERHLRSAWPIARVELSWEDCTAAIAASRHEASELLLEDRDADDVGRRLEACLGRIPWLLVVP